jgi:hypothetical protein
MTMRNIQVLRSVGRAILRMLSHCVSFFLALMSRISSLLVSSLLCLKNYLDFTPSSSFSRHSDKELPDILRTFDGEWMLLTLLQKLVGGLCIH